MVEPLPARLAPPSARRVPRSSSATHCWACAAGIRRQPPTMIKGSRMQAARISLALAVILAPSAFAAGATSQPEPPVSANQLFEAGKFAEAGEIYARLASENPRGHWAVLRSGRI